MSNELAIYKQKRIRALQNIYNANISRMYSALVANVRGVQNARIAVNIKQARINSLVAQYNKDAAALGDAFNKNKLAIQNFAPPTVKPAKRKRALLVGINYIGTTNELFGCINDVMSIKERITNA